MNSELPIAHRRSALVLVPLVSALGLAGNRVLRRLPGLGT
jgi:hypothetical protein